MLEGDDDEVTHCDDIDHKESTDVLHTYSGSLLTRKLNSVASTKYCAIKYSRVQKRRLSTSDNLHTHDLTTFISLIFATVRFTLISDEKHISWAH